MAMGLGTDTDPVVEGLFSSARKGVDLRENNFMVNNGFYYYYTLGQFRVGFDQLRVEAEHHTL